MGAKSAFSHILVVVCALALAACGSSGMPGVLKPVEAGAPGAHTVDLMVASARGYDDASGDFTNKRAKNLSFQALKISVPPNHAAGNIEWPAALPGNPATSFVTLSNQPADAQAFLRGVERHLPPSGEVLVFIHGYNNKHEEAVFRNAQLKIDSGTSAAPITFTWPSRGDVTDYVTDRESIMAARNRLLDLLVLLKQSPRIRKINLFAHSMGGMLTAETLMLLKLRGDAELAGKLDAVVFASPDIDVDVFLAQFEIIGKRPRPTIILVSRDDKALRVSRRIAGDVVRVGAASVRDPASVAAIQKYGFTVIDMTDMDTSDRSAHTKFAASPVFLQQMGNHLQSGLTRSAGGVGAFIADTAGTILEAPATILHKVAQ